MYQALINVCTLNKYIFLPFVCVCVCCSVVSLRQVAARGVVAVLGDVWVRGHDEDVGVCSGGDAHPDALRAARRLPFAAASHHGAPRAALHHGTVHQVGGHSMDAGQYCC